MKVAAAETDLRATAQLIKPALLYADSVTIYSPAASMMTAVADLGGISDPRQQVLVALGLIEEVPQLASQLNVPRETLEQFKIFLSLSPRLVRRVAGGLGARAEVDTIYEQLGGLEAVWREQIPEAIEEVKERLGADELIVAMHAGAVKVADLGGAPTSEFVADALRAATGEPDASAVDDLVAGFAARIVEILSEPRSFPLFDAQSSGLARALEAEAGLAPSHNALRKGAEVTSAASFMGFLPYFPELPIDEVLDLRSSLREPLGRFRVALAKLSKEFASRSIDDTFEVEVEEVWRTQVEPALSDIRETLAEHNLLREAASVALGDPRRLLAEAGGVLLAAHGEVVSVSGVVSAGLAAGPPLVDVTGRAVQRRMAARRNARRSAFYFLHRLGQESRQRS